MSIDCALGCGKPLNPHDIGVWKEVSGFVGGPKKDSMALRADTGRFAHDACVHKAKQGAAPDQPSVFEKVLPLSTGILREENEFLMELDGIEVDE